MSKQFNKREICHILRTLQKKEQREFRNFLDFRGKHNIAKMWQYLRKWHPKYEVSDEAVHNSVRPDKPYNDRSFRVLIAEFYAFAKEYVAYLEFRSDNLLHHNTLALALLHRNDEHTYKKVQRDAKKLYGTESPKFVEVLQRQFEMEDLNYQYTTIYQHRSTSDTLQVAANCLDIGWLTTKLKYLVLMHNRSRITGEQHRYILEKEIIDYLDKYPPSEPLIILYYKLVKLHQNLENMKIFLEFSNNFKLFQEKIELSEGRDLLTFAINIAFWNIRLGHLEYLPLRFSLAKIMADGNYALVNNRYHVHHFLSIIRSAILAGEVNWAAQFLEQNITQAKQEERENLATFCRAFIHFSRKEYDQQAPFMQKMEQTDYTFVDPQVNAVYRLLAIKTAYEQLALSSRGYPLSHFQSLMGAFRQYLKRRDRISGFFLLSCKHFLKALNLIYQFQYGNRSLTQTALKKEILEMQPLAELPWLLRQV